MSFNLQGTYVSEKISKIRWRPDQFNNSHYFISGSWDNDENSITLWDINESQEDDVFPYSLTKYSMQTANVTELKFLNSDYFACSSSFGSVNLMEIATSVTEDIKIKPKTIWKDIHKFSNDEPSPCTSFAVYEYDIASIGEDGRINLLTAQSEKVVRQIDNADSCSLNCVIFLKHNEILTSNLRGQMKIFDLRCEGNEASNTFMLSGEPVTPTCLTYHPTQRHLIIAGDDLGCLTTWDLRNNTFPVNVLNAHESGICEIQFHPDHPDQLFSCSEAGDIWHWSTKSKSISYIPDESSNIWISPDNIKNKLEVFTLIPSLGKAINSFDLNRDKVLCGCDNEAIYLINNVTVYH